MRGTTSGCSCSRSVCLIGRSADGTLQDLPRVSSDQRAIGCRQRLPLRGRQDTGRRDYRTQASFSLLGHSRLAQAIVDPFAEGPIVRIVRIGHLLPRNVGSRLRVRNRKILRQGSSSRTQRPTRLFVACMTRPSKQRRRLRSQTPRGNRRRDRIARAHVAGVSRRLCPQRAGEVAAAIKASGVSVE